MAKPKNPVAVALASLTKKLAKAKPDKAYPLLYEAFLYIAAAGNARGADRILGWMYGGRLPAPRQVATANSTQTLDAFCAAAGLGDRTNGHPRAAPSSDPPPPLVERAQNADRMIRWQVSTDQYGSERLEREAWTALPASDPGRRINQWRDIQEAAAPTADGDPRTGDAAALKLLAELFASFGPDERGAGHGQDLIVALDIALRSGRRELAAEWVNTRGGCLRDPFRIAMALCLSSIAAETTNGLLRPVIGLSDAELAAAVDALEAALPATTSNAKPASPPTVQKRRVGCEYSQLYLEPDVLDENERAELYFQDPRETVQGMSLFRTHVGIASPTDTQYCDVEVTLDSASAASKLDDVVQAVAFPIDVRGPMRLRSVGGEDDHEEPIAIPEGRYDVLASFVAKKAQKREAKAGLRVFSLRLSFRPADSIGTPRCFRLENGTTPPDLVFARSA